VIPAAFDYVAPTTVDDAVRALSEAGEDAKVIAGGQSLLPVLRMRLATPSKLIDLGRVPELRGVREDGDRLVIGAMTTHYDVQRDPLIAEHAPLLALTTNQIADPQVRHRGTFADYLLPSAADLPSFTTDRTETPSTTNPLGAKGVGEAGTIASTPAVVNAVIDAVRHFGVNDIEMPLTPMRVWHAIQHGTTDAGGPGRDEAGGGLGSIDATGGAQ
jgi:hypothetical protein